MHNTTINTGWLEKYECYRLKSMFNPIVPTQNSIFTLKTMAG